MTTIALVGLVPAVAVLVEAALRGEGHLVTRLALDAETVRAVGHVRPDVLVLDGHAYVNTRTFLTALRDQPTTAAQPVVLLGLARPSEVPHFEEVQFLGRSFDVRSLLTAVDRAVGRSYTG